MTALAGCRARRTPYQPVFLLFSTRAVRGSDYVDKP